MPDTNETDTGKTLGELAKDIVTQPEAKQEPKVNNGDLLTKHGLKAMHFKATDDRAAFTVVWTKNSFNAIEFATAVTHHKDTFTKKTGTQLAIERFISGQTAMLPIRKFYGVRESVVDTLKYYFEE
jgi:hypothetical protein